MGMSTHAIGFKPADEEWNKMKHVWDVCDNAGISVPDEVQKYFDYEYPKDKPGMVVDLGESCKVWNDENCFGYEIDVSKLPEGVKYIRVYNSV